MFDFEARLFAVLGSDGSERDDVQGGQGINVTIFAHDAYFMRSNQDELGVRHLVLPAVRSANRKGSKPSTQLSPNFLNVHVYAVPQAQTQVKLRVPALMRAVTVTADLTIVGGYLFLLAWSTGLLYGVH